MPFRSIKIETDTLRFILASSLFMVFFAGCDTAAKQQQAEDARAAATAATLKQTGEDLHNSTSSNPGVEPAQNDSP
ncbi:MAG: hypothetical protein AAGA03_10950 [Planctomycetota bacterium]